MAVAFDSVGPSAAGATIAANTVLTFSHTVVGNNVVLLAGIAVDSGADASLSCTCTYAGSPMTSLGVVHSGGISAGFLQVFVIETAPGTANVVATVAGGTPANLSGGSIAVSGAAAPVATGHGTPATANTPTGVTTATCALASNTSGNLIVGFTCSGTSIASATAPSTSRFIKSQAGSGAAGSVAGATSPATGSSVTMAWTMGSDDFAELIVEILPLPPAGGPIRLAQQTSRALMKRRKASQRPQFNLQSPSVSIFPALVTASAAIPVPVLVRTITGLGGVPGAGYFTDQAGAPRFVLGDAAWAWCGNAGRWNSGNWQADFDTYLANRAGQGYTIIYTKPMGTVQSLNINNDGRTFDPLFPFQGGTPSTGVSGASPSTGLTAAYWARIDYMLASALNKGITIFLNAIGYGDDFTTNGPLAAKGTTEFTAYGTALGSRYKNQPNIVWHLSDDYFGSADNLITAFMAGVSGAGDTHAVSIENMAESDSRNTFDASPSVCAWGTTYAKYNFCYSYNVTYVGIEKAYLESSPVPVIQGDGYFYQGTSTYNGGNAETSASAFDRAMRQDAWHAISSGARGVIQGYEGIWQWQSTALAESGTDWWPVHNTANIRTLVESLPNWHLLIPDTSSVLVTAGRGTHATTFASGGGGGQYEIAFTDSYVSASRTAAGDLALIYMSHGSTITIDQTKMVTGYLAYWTDPITGVKTLTTSGTTYNSTAHGTNSQGGPDWVLVLQAPPSNVPATPAVVTASVSVPTPVVSAGFAAFTPPASTCAWVRSSFY